MIGLWIWSEINGAMWAWVGMVLMQVNGMFFFVFFSLEPHARMNPAKDEDDIEKWERSYLVRRRPWIKESGCCVGLSIG